MSQSNRCRVYVGNLSWKVRWQQLKDHMKQVGEVIRADIIQDYDGKSRGCGIVEFSSAEYAAKAINELNDTMIMQRPIFVREDREEYGTGLRKNRRYSHNNRDGYENGVNGAKYRPKNYHEQPQEQDNYYYDGQGVDEESREDVGRRDFHGNEEERDRRVREDDKYGDNEYYDVERGVEDEYEARGEDCHESEGYYEDYTQEEGEMEPEGSQEESRYQHQYEKDSFSTKSPRYSRNGGYDRNSNLTVIVTNLQWRTSWQNLKDLFKTCGPVARVDIMSHQDGRSKGVAKITFGNEYAAKKAVNTFHQFTLGGRRIGVRFANTV